MEKFLAQLQESLERLEVRGADNLNILLGCILAIKNAREALEAPPEIPKEEEAENG